MVARSASPFLSHFASNSTESPGYGTFGGFYPITPYFNLNNNGPAEIWKRHEREVKALMRLGKFKQARESFERAQEELYSYELQSRFSQFGGFTDNAVRNLKTRLKISTHHHRDSDWPLT